MNLFRLLYPLCLDSAFILYLFIHRLLDFGHSCQFRMHGTIRRSLYWPLMAANVKIMVSKCTVCTQNISKYHHRRVKILSWALISFDLVAMDKIKTFTKTTRNNLYRMVVAYWYFGVAWAFPRSETSLSVAKTFYIQSLAGALNDSPVSINGKWRAAHKQTLSMYVRLYWGKIRP